MRHSVLADIYDRERDTAAVFQELPFHYIEIAYLLLRHAKDCFPDLYKVWLITLHLDISIWLCPSHAGYST